MCVVARLQLTFSQRGVVTKCSRRGVEPKRLLICCVDEAVLAEADLGLSSVLASLPKTFISAMKLFTKTLNKPRHAFE